MAPLPAVSPVKAGSEKSSAAAGDSAAAVTGERCSRMGARTDSAVFFYLNTEMQEKNYFRLYNFSLKWAANAPKHTKWNIHNLFGISRPSLSVA